MLQWGLNRAGQMIGWSRQSKASAFLLLDCTLVFASLFGAIVFAAVGTYSDSVIFGMPADPVPFGPFAFSDYVGLMVVASLACLAVIAAQLFRIRLRSFDIVALRRILITSVVLSGIFGFHILFFGPRLEPISAIYFGLLFCVGAVGVRLVLLSLAHVAHNAGRAAMPVAVYGANATGAQLVSSLRQVGEINPVLLVDDNPAMRGVIVGGLKVQPTVALENAAKAGSIRSVLFTENNVSPIKRSKLIGELERYSIQVQVIPSYLDLVVGRAAYARVPTIDTQSLLGRDEVKLDSPELVHVYRDKTVMVTGAGGSIGSEFCYQLIKCAPRTLVLYECNEHALWCQERKLRPVCARAGINLIPVLGSVTDRAAVRDVLASCDVNHILHAAAHKHVPLVEQNAIEGARNNILGTMIVAEEAGQAGVERFVLVSTDKAVRPSSVMGATKRAAELTVAGLQSKFPDTKFSFVRFGNVLGSSGSVIRVFEEQLAAGGPLTVTHPDAVRFFMTGPEAASLLMLAGAYSQGNDFFVLDMGQPVRILDMAKRMIRQSGATVRDIDNPDGEVEIIFTGLRPGEKLHEELFIEPSLAYDRPHERIMRRSYRAPSEFEHAALTKSVEVAIRDRSLEALNSVLTSKLEDAALTFTKDART